MTGYTPVTNHHESPTEPTSVSEQKGSPPDAGTSPDADPGAVPDAAPDAVSDVRELVDIPAVEVISRAVVMLMSAAAEQLGLASDDPGAPMHRDLDQARTLITALAGLVNAAAPDLGPHAAAFRDGLAALQAAFREYSVHPDEPGHGPGERAPR